MDELYTKEARQQRFSDAVIKFNSQRKNDDIYSNRYDSFSTAFNTAIGTAATTLGGISGVTQVSPVFSNLLSKGMPTSPLYSTSPLRQLNNIPGQAFNDFRSRKSNIALGLSADTRTDGISSVTGIRSKGALYAAASKVPGGVYNLFNRNAPGTFGYGWGDHGNKYAIRNDFTLRSQVTTQWAIGVDEKGIYGNWVDGPLYTKAIPFRGDRVNVIDYRKKVTLDQAYEWRKSLDFLGGGTAATKRLASKLDLTQDFIKFFLTGPKLRPGATTETDEIIVFRATMDSITDSFQPSWTPVSLIGRADPNYHYSSYSRDVSVDFTIYATDRDEMKPIYRKLNALAGYTAPDYSGNTIGLTGPWMRITIGDLFNQVPVIISSLSYTFGDSETPWEINIENDPNMMQVPFKIQVSLSFTVISDWLPQKGGQFYSLAKRHDTFGPLQGSDNWLSDNMQQNQLKVLRDAKIKADTDAANAAKAAAAKNAKQFTTAQTTSEFNDMSNPLLPPTG